MGTVLEVLKTEKQRLEAVASDAQEKIAEITRHLPVAAHGFFDQIKEIEQKFVHLFSKPALTQEQVEAAAVKIFLGHTDAEGVVTAMAATFSDSEDSIREQLKAGVASWSDLLDIAVKHQVDRQIAAAVEAALVSDRAARAADSGAKVSTDASPKADAPAPLEPVLEATMAPQA